MDRFNQETPVEAIFCLEYTRLTFAQPYIHNSVQIN